MSCSKNNTKIINSLVRKPKMHCPFPHLPTYISGKTGNIRGTSKTIFATALERDDLKYHQMSKSEILTEENGRNF